MIQGLLLRWVVAGLFALAAVECGLPIVMRRRPWPSVISHGLHFTMAVAMIVMAWPWSARLPTAGPVTFFVLAAAFFVTMAVVAARMATRRALYGYHAVMMLATAWMYAIMNSHLLPLGSAIQHHAQHDKPMPDMDMDMAGTDMAGMNMSAGGGSPVWLNAVDWLGAATFAAATVFWTCRYVIDRKHDVARLRSMGNVGQAMMAAGMTTFFLAMLFQI